MARRISRTGSRPLVSVLTRALLVLSISALLLVGGVQIYYNIRAYISFVAQQESILARETANSIATFVRELVGALETASHIGAPNFARSGERDKLLVYLLNYQPVFRRLLFLDSGGQRLSDVSRVSTATRDPLDRVEEGWWEEVAQRGRYISPAYMDEVTGEPMMVMAVVVKDVFKNVRGVLVAEVNLRFMWDLTYRMQIGERGQVYVVDRKGNLIASRDIARTLSGEGVSHLREVAEFMSSSAPGDENGAGVAPGLSGDWVLATYVPLGEPDWAVVTELPVMEAYRPAIGAVGVLLAVAVGVGGLVALFSRRVAHQLSMPLEELAHVASRLGEGDLDVQVAVRGTAEVVTLAGVFNQMAAQLREMVGRLEDLVAERTEALARRTAQLEAAATVARRAAEIRDVDTLLNETVRLISDRFGFYHAGIFLLDERREYAVLQAASSEGGQRMLARGHRLKVGQVGIVGYVAGTGEPRIALDVGTDAVFFDNPDLPLTHSEMALPLKVGERVIGVLDVQSEEPAAFTREDVAVLQTMADQIALAIENARTLRQMERTLQELERVYGEYTREAWQAVRRSRRWMGRRYRRLLPEPAEELTEEARRALLEGRPILQPIREEGDGRVVSTLLAVPMKLRGQVIGALNMRFATEVPPEAVRMVEEIADRLALALENARLLEETRRRAEREHLASEISQKLTTSVRIESILQIAAEELNQALGGAEVLVQILPEVRRASPSETG